MVMCIHSQEFDTCSFGCTFHTSKELKLDNEKLKKRIKELESKLEEWENIKKFVLSEDCPTDEVHCGCVIILKKRIKELEAALKEIILTQPIACDGAHQGDYACDLHKEIAEKALKKGGE